MNRPAPGSIRVLEGRNGRTVTAPFLHFLCFLFAAAILARGQTSSLEKGEFRIEIVLEQQAGSEWIAVDPGLVLPAESFIRFRVRLNFKGYLYAVNLGSNGQYALLFPRAEAGLDNRVEAERDYLIPALEGGYRITGPPGFETVYWLISPTELRAGASPPSLSLPPPSPPPARTPAGKLIPRCNDELFRARGEGVDVSAGTRTLEQKELLPGGLTAAQEAASSRELQFSRRKETSVVSSSPTADAPVLFEFRIAHR